MKMKMIRMCTEYICTPYVYSGFGLANRLQLWRLPGKNVSSPSNFSSLGFQRGAKHSSRRICHSTPPALPLVHSTSARRNNPTGLFCARKQGPGGAALLYRTAEPLFVRQPLNGTFFGRVSYHLFPHGRYISNKMVVENVSWVGLMSMHIFKWWIPPSLAETFPSPTWL